MDNKLKYDSAPNANEKFMLETKRMDLDAGWFGKIFGAKPVSPINIASFFILLLLLSGIVLSFTNKLSDAIEYWKIISALITLALGYIFGKNSKDT